MNLRGYKFFDEEKTRRSADVLKMEKGEAADKFIKRCKSLGYDVVDGRNLVNHYKFMEDDLIRDSLNNNRIKNLNIMCVNLINDFNIASCIRACNAFSVNKIYIFGDKNFDRRGTVGTHNYENFVYINNLDELPNILKEFDEIISLDNISDAVNLNEHNWDYSKKTLIIIGQESIGVPGELLEASTKILSIKQTGSVRSLNVSQATGIILYDYTSGL